MSSQETLEPPFETLDGSEDSTVEVEGSQVAGLSTLAVGDDADKLPFGVGPSDISGRPGTLLRSSPREVSTISQEKIVIRNNFGENLVGILHETGSMELVIICHGFRSSKESKTLMSLTDALTKEKICVFRFDFAGNGDSEGTFQYGNYRREVDDLRAVILYFSGQKREVNAIVGHSKGGNVVLLYASMYRDISKVVNISGRFDLGRGIIDRLGKDFMQRIRDDRFINVSDKRGKFMYRVTEESLMDRLSTDMHAACLSIDQNCKVLTVHGSEDEIVPTEDALEFAKYITNHKLHIIEGADHRYASHQFLLARILLEFVTFN